MHALVSVRAASPRKPAWPSLLAHARPLASRRRNALNCCCCCRCCRCCCCCFALVLTLCCPRAALRACPARFAKTRRGPRGPLPANAHVPFTPTPRLAPPPPLRRNAHAIASSLMPTSSAHPPPCHVVQRHSQSRYYSRNASPYVTCPARALAHHPLTLHIGTGTGAIPSDRGLSHTQTMWMQNLTP